MLTLRRAQERGHTEIGWLDSWHTFSFDQYFDPQHMGFGPLRVINEDYVEPGKGFPTHPHRDMEIITYVLEGELAHQDSLGNGSVIRPGEIQKMSAGTGILHSEYNPSKENQVHLLQIWIQPQERNLQPMYEQHRFSLPSNTLTLLGSANGDGFVTIHQNVQLFAFKLENSGSVSYELPKERVAWVQIARGQAELNGQPVTAGDGIAASEEPTLTIAGSPSAEGLLFVMAPKH